MTSQGKRESAREVGVAFLCAFAAALGAGIANVAGQQATLAWERYKRREKKRRKRG